MSIHRYAAKVDGNQGDIIKAIEATGASVEVLRKPLDLLIGAGGRWGILEIKASEYESRRPSKTRKGQLAFAERHPAGGPVGTVWDVAGALHFVATLRGTE